MVYKVRLLGISNVDATRLAWLLSRCRIQPAFVQNKFRGMAGWDSGVRSICDANSIIYQAFWLISGNRALLGSAELGAAAAWRKKTPAQMIVRFAVQDHMVALTGSTNMDHAAENIELDFVLSTREMAAIKSAGQGLGHTSSTAVQARFWNGLR